MRSFPSLALAALALCAGGSLGCMSWQPGWVSHQRLDAAPGDAATLLGEARQASAVALDAEGLRRAMAAYERVLAVDPAEPTALVMLADHSILLGTAYTTTRGEKQTLYDYAMALAERAMYADPEFRALADGGARPWEAAHVLGEEHMRAMMVWSTALLYRFKETMGGPARVANVRWIERLDPLLDRMEQLDEGWDGGAVPFTRAFYRFVLPPSRGGDREAAAAAFARGLEMGPDRLLHRWGRARFFHVLTGNREGFVEDLTWVLAQDPARVTDRPEWAAYIRRDARQLLADVERYFGPGRQSEV
jgi:tetratricopeptide (TPR) repeat protein